MLDLTVVCILGANPAARDFLFLAARRIIPWPFLVDTLPSWQRFEHSGKSSWLAPMFAKPMFPSRVLVVLDWVVVSLATIRFDTAHVRVLRRPVSCILRWPWHVPSILVLVRWPLDNFQVACQWWHIQPNSKPIPRIHRNGPFVVESLWQFGIDRARHCNLLGIVATWRDVDDTRRWRRMTLVGLFPMKSPSSMHFARHRSIRCIVPCIATHCRERNT